jgi:hypothetical protein
VGEAKKTIYTILRGGIVREIYLESV